MNEGLLTEREALLEILAACIVETQSKALDDVFAIALERLHELKRNAAQR